MVSGSTRDLIGVQQVQMHGADQLAERSRVLEKGGEPVVDSSSAVCVD
jgi:hypothetical protein